MARGTNSHARLQGGARDAQRSIVVQDGRYAAIRGSVVYRSAGCRMASWSHREKY